MSGNEKYDFVLAGGRVVDPAQNIDAVMDVAVADGRVAAVAPNLASRGKETVDCSGKIVTPGLIDEHAHFYAFSMSGIPADQVGVDSGVVTAVDCGSSGYMNYHHFKQLGMEPAATDLYACLNQSPVGHAILPEMWSPARIRIDYPHLIETIQSDPERIIGLKARAVAPYITGLGIEGIEKARDVCERCGIHFVVHVGLDNGDEMADRELNAFTRELLRLLAPGDILAHAFTGKRGGVMRRDGLFDREIRDACERGVLLDCCFGGTNFSAEAFRIGRERGFHPQLMSTDLSPVSITGAQVNRNIGIGMSKLLALGVELPAVVDMVTRSAAKAIRMDDRKGSLLPGRAADITVSELVPGGWKFLDSAGGETLRSGELFTARRVYRAGKGRDVIHSGGPTFIE